MHKNIKEKNNYQTVLTILQIIVLVIILILGIFISINLKGRVISKDVILPSKWRKVRIPPKDWNIKKITPITDGINNVPLPKGYRISEKSTEQTVEKGLVIKDNNGNEFVWIPVNEELVNTYKSPTGYCEPKEIEAIWKTNNQIEDGQETLNFLFGTKEDGTTPYLNYETDFNYEKEYIEMTESVNKYHGFFVGRYETTIDENGKVGSVENTQILTSRTIMKDGINLNNNANYYYRWHGLYYIEKNSKYIEGNGENVQSAMMYGQLWDKMIDFFKNENIDYSATQVTTRTSAEELVNSAQSTYLYNNENIKDVILNIYDLRGNGVERTQEADHNYKYRVNRGGYYEKRYAANCRSYDSPLYSGSYYASRLALYIK